MPEANRIVVPPVEAGAARPLWSVMIPTYNCADYLRETLASVLAQDPGPEQMQIEVVDDYSTRDDPEAVVRELAGERVVFHRQERNVGHVRNFETCLLRSRGELVHLLHGDDRVRPGFYRTMQEPFLSDPRIGAAFCRHIYLDERRGDQLSPLERPVPGVLENWLEQIASGQRLATPSVVVRRSVYQELGGFDRRIHCAGEDWEMWVRIAAHYPVWFEPQLLAEYRVKREGSLTSDARSCLRIVRDMRLAKKIIGVYLKHHLPEEAARSALRNAGLMYAFWALSDLDQLLQRREISLTFLQVVEALRCSPRPGVLRLTAGKVLHAGREWFGQARDPAA